MKTTLIIFPLIIFFAISMMFIVYDTTGLTGEKIGTGFTLQNPANEEYLYDWTGRPILYWENMTTVSESGYVNSYINTNTLDNIEDNVKYAIWINQTWSIINVNAYYLYYSSDGNSSATYEQPITYEDFENHRVAVTQTGLLSITGSMSTSMGLLVLITSLIIGIAFLGFNFFGSGVNDSATKFIIVASGLIAIWLVFSVISLEELSQIPYGLGSILYLGLTLAYCAGIILNGGST